MEEGSRRTHSFLCEVLKLFRSMLIEIWSTLDIWNANFPREIERQFPPFSTIRFFLSTNILIFLLIAGLRVSAVVHLAMNMGGGGLRVVPVSVCVIL